MNRGERRRQQKLEQKKQKTAHRQVVRKSGLNDVKSLTERALQHHSAGRLKQAQANYRKILQLEPDNPVAMHLLGVIALQSGTPEEAVNLIGDAIRANPQYFEAHYNLGNTLMSLKRAADALESYRKALSIRPQDVDTLNNMGNALKVLGRLGEAAECYRKALTIAPDHAETYSNLGGVLKQMGKIEEAVSCYIRALEIRPDSAEIHNNLGTALKEKGLWQEALESYEQALSLKPGFAEAHYNYGGVLYACARLDEAVGHYRRALSLNPNYLDAYNNLGNALNELGRPEEAVQCFKQALALRPDDSEVLNNMGNALKELGRWEDSFECFQRAIALRPDYPEAHKNLGLFQLLIGDYRNGWANYAWRWKITKDPFKKRGFDKPQWEGEDIRGKTILIHCEQGLGDVIQFSRYLQGLWQKCGSIFFEVPKPLLRIFRQNSIADWVGCAGDEIPPFDLHLSLIELPRVMNETLETLPGEGGYLRPDGGLRKKMAGHFDQGDGFRIGIVWAGNRDHKNDHNRSMKADLLNPLTEIPGVSVYSLQLGRDGESLAVFGSTVTDLAPFIDDFADTAAAVSHLDLIVTVDTSVAHIAGALGGAVWTMLPSTPDWRWMLGREDSPWYQTMRLFRQEKRGDWEGVVRRVSEELMKKVPNAVK